MGEDFLSSYCRMIETLMQAFVVPALRKVREERGTRFVGTVKEIKGRATRPNLPRAEIEILARV
jgi:hypothetical protein